MPLSSSSNSKCKMGTYKDAHKCQADDLFISVRSRSKHALFVCIMITNKSNHYGKSLLFFCFFHYLFLFGWGFFRGVGGGGGGGVGNGFLQGILSSAHFLTTSLLDTGHLKGSFQYS